MDHGCGIRRQNQPATRLAGEGLDGALKVGGVIDRFGHKIYSIASDGASALAESTK